MARFCEEFEQESFDPEEFVERIAWKAMGGGPTGKDMSEDFDPVLLYDNFSQIIRSLQEQHMKKQHECEQLEASMKEEQKKHGQRMFQLMEKNKNSYEILRELDEKINFVATKVVHLGDQLESVNTPRSRAVEALQLMRHLDEFMIESPFFPEVFADKSKIHEAADIIQKLHLIAQELPAEKFDSARKRIGDKYDEIERSLLEEFVEAQREGDRQRMKEVAAILSHFKGYSQCVDAFIEQSQLSSLANRDIFREIVPLCEKNETVMQEVFTNPEQVMGKFILNIYHGKLQEYIQAVLEDRSNPGRYLEHLHELYIKTLKLSGDLAKFDMGNDSSYLNKLTRHVFHRYLDTYISIETRYLKEKSVVILRNYYTSKNHQKRQLQTGGIGRDIRAYVENKTNININIGQAVENYGGETFLSEEVAINLLQEAKKALKRCQQLSRQSDLAANATQIFDLLVKYLIVEHIDYALELGLNGIPPAESKSAPEVYFFDTVRQCNAIVHLLEKQFNDSLVPLVVSTPKHGDCLQKKKDMLEQVEVKLDTGLDRTIASVVGWVKILLQTEQKKTDFRPESEDGVIAMASVACTRVVKFMNRQVEKIKDSLDGKNVELVLLELGTRFHRVIYEHLQQFQYNLAGAMCVICDLNEYRKCVQEFKVNQVLTLFDTLHALCNLLLVPPENLKQVCSGDQLAMLDRSILSNFIQLRADYKTAKLATQLRW